MGQIEELSEVGEGSKFEIEFNEVEYQKKKETKFIENWRRNR